MKARFFDHTTETDLFVFETPRQEFGSNMFNLFMAEMVKVHGHTFQKLNAQALNGVICIDYSHNVRCILDPQKG